LGSAQPEIGAITGCHVSPETDPAFFESHFRDAQPADLLGKDFFHTFSCCCKKFQLHISPHYPGTSMPHKKGRANVFDAALLLP
jgi:hypothetical protein